MHIVWKLIVKSDNDGLERVIRETQVVWENVKNNFNFLTVRYARAAKMHNVRMPDNDKIFIYII